MEQSIGALNKIKGSFRIPASKSHGQRVLACSFINLNQTVIHNLGVSDDEQGLLNLISDAGTTVISKDGTLIVRGIELMDRSELHLNCRESGLASRMITPILANANFTIELNGHGSLLKRPMNQFDNILNELGVNFQSKDGKLPFQIHGPLKPQNIKIDGSLSSQFVTGLILGFVASPFLKNEIIEVVNPTSIPYIELTLDVLRNFGVELNFENNKIQFAGPYTLKETEIEIEGDWSSASFFLVAAAILGDITIHGLNIESKQADRKILEALQDFGAEISIENGVRIVKKEFNAFNFDATHCPDLFPPLAVLASFSQGESKIKGVSRLIHKESNRAVTIQSELTKMGAQILISDDVMIIQGIEKANGAKIDTHGDHRIAMACAIMALKADKPTVIQNYEVVNKSFPRFYDYLEKLT
ncbi:MAG: 3-phosphoshikimate 1-carboxyvinyltransferase [Bacteroidetes bacterium]|nr:3-phosphoshikimate 1-carboxyvinyltransferase [Bacteroidota bacterium]